MTDATLLDLPIGTWGQIGRLAGDPELCERLSELGFTAGEWARPVAQAPWGGALAVNLRGAVFALRTGEAACVKITEAR